MSLPRSFSLLLCASALLLSPIARGQAVYGSIYGVVTDASGADVPSATVVVTDTNEGTAHPWSLSQPTASPIAHSAAPISRSTSSAPCTSNSTSSSGPKPTRPSTTPTQRLRRLQPRSTSWKGDRCCLNHAAATVLWTHSDPRCHPCRTPGSSPYARVYLALVSRQAPTR